MRLPWLQINADGQTRARLLGRLLGVHELQGVGMALALWTWALEMAPDGDFSGAVSGDAELIAAAMGWPSADAPRLLVELVRVGLLESTPALRVRGLDRYKQAWAKNKRMGHGLDKSLKTHDHPGGIGAGPARDPLGTRAIPVRKTETETEKKEDVPPPKTRKPSAAQELVAWLNATRASKTPLTDSPISGVRINKLFGDALNQHGRPAVERAYIAFLELPEPGAMDPPWPWQSFLKRLPMLAVRPPLAAVPKSRTLAPGEDPYADQLA